MITKYYVDAAGNYIGGFYGAQPPDGAIEVANPPEHGSYKWVNGAWAGPTLAEKQAATWENIKAERARREAGGVLVGTHWFHSDDTSRIKQLGLKIFGVSVPPVQWKTMTGEFVPMTQELANGIFQAVASTDQAIFTRAEQHKAAMMASADPANYDFSAGWPLAFGE